MTRQLRNLPRIGQRCLEKENGKEKLRYRGQNENVKYIAVGETEGESRADACCMKRKRRWNFQKLGKACCRKSILQSVLAGPWKCGGQMARTLYTQGSKRPP